MAEPVVRPAVEGDLSRLVAVEAAAGQRFHAVGMPAIAEDVPEVEELRESLALGRLWVVQVGPEVAGYVSADLVDGDAYVGQVSVDTAHAGRGLGRLLLEHVEEWGRDVGCRATTLTTFRDVPWNAPYYRRLGYEELAADRIGPVLAAVIARQATLAVLGTAARIAMGKPNDHPG